MQPVEIEDCHGLSLAKVDSHPFIFDCAERTDP
jgi:hypothetical protein